MVVGCGDCAAALDSNLGEVLFADTDDRADHFTRRRLARLLVCSENLIAVRHLLDRLRRPIGEKHLGAWHEAVPATTEFAELVHRDFGSFGSDARDPAQQTLRLGDDLLHRRHGLDRLVTRLQNLAGLAHGTRFITNPPQAQISPLVKQSTMSFYPEMSFNISHAASLITSHFAIWAFFETSNGLPRHGSFTSSRTVGPQALF
nr:hypothetical protein [Lentzea sp. NBRC 102530]